MTPAFTWLTGYQSSYRLGHGLSLRCPGAVPQADTARHMLTISYLVTKAPGYETCLTGAMAGLRPALPIEPIRPG